MTKVIYIKSRGRSAIVIIVLVLLFIGFKYSAALTSLDNEGTQTLKVWLEGDYVRRNVTMFGENALDSLSYEEIDMIGNKLMEEMTDIEFKSISVRKASSKRKYRNGDEYIVKVEILVNGKPPEDGKPIRYFRMRHSLASGWHLPVWETSALAYHLSFF